MNTSYLTEADVGHAVAAGCERLILFASGTAALKDAATLPDDIRRLDEAYLRLVDPRLRTIQCEAFDGPSLHRRARDVAKEFRRASESLETAVLAAQRTAFAVLDFHAWQKATDHVSQTAAVAQRLSDEVTRRARAMADADGGPGPLGDGA